MYSSELGWAPHLIGVELVGAPEFVAVLSPLNAVIELFFSLEAEFPVPLVALEVAHHVHSLVTDVHRPFLFIII